MLAVALSYVFAVLIPGATPALHAQDAAPFFTLQPTGTVVMAGQSVQFIAEVSGNPLPQLSWQLNGADLADQNASTLTLDFVATNQSGIYRLQASNAVGVAYSDAAMLSVLPAYPAILVQPTNVTAFEGDSVSLSVQAMPTPGVATYYQWLKDGVPLVNQYSNLIGVDQSKLQLLFPGLANTGNYHVIVTNDYGAVTSEVAVLTIQPGLTTAGWVDKSFDVGMGFNGSGINGHVQALALQPDGKVLVGGSFYYFNEQPVSGIARLNTDGTLDDSFSLSNAVSGEVLAIALQSDGKILIGGRFSSVGTFSRNHMARLNADGSVDPSFVLNPAITVPFIGGETVSAILVQDGGQILHAGTSYLMGRRLADGSLDATFQPFIQQFSGGTRNEPFPARCLAFDHNGKLLLGGGDLIGISRFLASGQRDLSFPSPKTTTNFASSYPDVYAVAELMDGRILIGGTFTQISDAPRRGLACLNPDGSLSPTFAGVLSNGIAVVNTILRLPDGKVMIAGLFPSISGVPTPAGLARLNADGSLDTSFDTSRRMTYEPMPVTGITTPLTIRDSGELLMGGKFSRFGGFLRGSLVQLHGDAPQPPAITTQPAAQTVEEGRRTTLFVEATFPPQASYQWLFNGTAIQDATNQNLSLPDISLSQAGDYSVIVSNALGSVTSEIAHVTVTSQLVFPGATDISFFNGPGVNGRVFCSAMLPDGKTLIGGQFTAVHGVPRHYVARLNTDGSLDESFDAGVIALGRIGYDFNFGTGIFAINSDAEGRVYLGGSFTNIAGVACRGIARLTPSGAVDGMFQPGNGADNVVFSVIPQMDGRVLIGGAFTTVDNLQRRLVARLNADGRVDATFASPFTTSSADWTAYSLHPLADGRILVAGKFSVATRLNLIRIHPNGALDVTIWSPAASLNNVPRALLVDGSANRYYVAGLSSALFQEGKNERIVCLNSNASVFTNFDANTRAQGSVRALAFDVARRLWIGTTSTNINGAPRTYLARLNADGAVDTNFNAVLDGTVSSIIPRYRDDTVLITGDFTFVNGARRSGVARVRGDPVLSPIFTNQPVSQSVASGQAVTFAVGVTRPLGDVVQWFFNGAPIPGATGALLSLANPLTTQGGKYFAVATNIAGAVTSAVVTLTVAQPNLTPGRVDFEFASGLGFGPDGPVYAMALQPDGKLLIGGSFSNVQGVARQQLARLNVDGSLDRTFDSSPLEYVDPQYSPPVVRAVAVQADGKVLIGGRFRLFPPASVSYFCLARLHADGRVDSSFNAGYMGDPETRALLLQPDGNILGGRVNYGGLIRLHATNGMRDASFQAVTDNAVMAIARMVDGRILAGGRFAQANGQPRNRIVRFYPTGELDFSFNPGTGADADVNGLAVQPDGKVVIGGIFSNVNGVPRPRIARLNVDGSLDTTFDPWVGPDAAVNALLVEQDGSILIAGDFTRVRGILRARLARLKPDGTLDESFDPGAGADGTIHALIARPGGGLYAGGAFTNFNGAPRQRVARLHNGVTLVQPQRGTNGFTTTLNTSTGRTYWLEATDDLANGVWSPVTSVAGNGLTQTLTSVPGGLPQFYRVRVE